MATQSVTPPTTALASQSRSVLATATFGALLNYEQAWDLAKRIAASDLVPKDFKEKAENCFIAMQMGAEIGLSPMASIQNIAVINGRPTLWGDSLLAVVMNHAQYESHEEFLEGDGDNRVGVFRIVRKGHKLHEVRFSVADAKRASLWGKAGPWTQYPDRMLKMRARGFGLRDKFADALRGMISAEEAGDYPGITINAEPVIPDADRILHDKCKVLLEKSGMNQANVEMKLSQHKGNYADLLARLERNLNGSNGGEHGTGNGRSGDTADRSDHGPAVSEVENRAAQSGAVAAESEAVVSEARADGPSTNDVPSEVVEKQRPVNTKPQPQSGFTF